jgi:hypothetical protein
MFRLGNALLRAFTVNGFSLSSGTKCLKIGNQSVSCHLVGVRANAPAKRHLALRHDDTETSDRSHQTASFYTTGASFGANGAKLGRKDTGAELESASAASTKSSPASLTSLAN